MRDKLIIVVAILVVLGLVWALNAYYRRDKKPSVEPVLDFSEEATAQMESDTRLIAVVETTMGTFSFKLFPKDAPGTVANFVKLARDGFYDGTIFHRVIDGFMIQGGDPTGSGSGGPGYTIKAEFNKRRHLPGTVAMARPADPDSAGSQFYVCLNLAPHLDRKYTVFGQVTNGMDVVKAIGKVPTDRNDRPKKKVVMNRVTIKEVPLEKK